MGGVAASLSSGVPAEVVDEPTGAGFEADLPRPDVDDVDGSSRRSEEDPADRSRVDQDGAGGLHSLQPAPLSQCISAGGPEVRGLPLVRAGERAQPQPYGLLPAHTNG